jgi:hypothetical protein
MKRMQIVFILCAFCVGCSEAEQDKLWPREQFTLQDGTVVSCRWYEEHACGVKLHDCTDGQTYTCQQGVSHD